MRRQRQWGGTGVPVVGPSTRMTGRNATDTRSHRRTDGTVRNARRTAEQGVEDTMNWCSTGLSRFVTERLKIAPLLPAASTHLNPTILPSGTRRRLIDRTAVARLPGATIATDAIDETHSGVSDRVILSRPSSRAIAATDATNRSDVIRTGGSTLLMIEPTSLPSVPTLRGEAGTTARDRAADGPGRGVRLRVAIATTSEPQRRGRLARDAQSARSMPETRRTILLPLIRPMKIPLKPDSAGLTRRATVVDQPIALIGVASSAPSVNREARLFLVPHAPLEPMQSETLVQADVGAGRNPWLPDSTQVALHSPTPQTVSVEPQ